VRLYDRSVFSGKNGCSTCSEFVIIRSKNASSASLNNSVTDDMSVSAKPNRLHRFRNESSRMRSAAEQVPDQAGAQ